MGTHAKTARAAQAVLAGQRATGGAERRRRDDTEEISMTLMDKNQMWEVIDLVIKENIKSNEAITSGTTPTCDVIITYDSIDDNILHKSAHVLGVYTLRLMSVPTLRMFIKEVIETLRYDAK
jgi:hypothetical protein